jgi:hypothetical protein
MFGIGPSEALSQPYTYGEVSGSEIYRVNLRTGSVDTIIHSVERFDDFFADPQGTRMFVGYKSGEYCAYDAEHPDTPMKTFSVDRGWMGNVLQGPGDLLYISRSYGLDVSEQGRSGILIVDRTTLAVIDSTEDLVALIDPADGHLTLFFSKDKEHLYSFVKNDKRGLFFNVASTATNRWIGTKRCGTVGEFVYGPVYDDGRSGYAVISYESAAGFINQKYVVCDVDEGSTRRPISFPYKSRVYLSGDGRRLIIERVQKDESRPRAEYATGTIYIFDSESSEMLRRVSLPPGGAILIFENYPNELFYYTLENGVPQSIIVSLDSIASTNHLLEYLISSKHESETNGWLGDRNFVKELDNHLQNAQKHLAKHDSVNARKEVEEFQEKVNKEYQKTLDDHKGGKHRDRRFVTEEGWKLLYFNAQYIIDRLPEKLKHGRGDHEKDKKPKE